MIQHIGLQEKLFPAFFRTDSGFLYACHHAPIDSVISNGALLLCNAIGHEYERCHRLLRQLALQGIRAGRHSMQFDYSGTGDSAGDYEVCSLQDWRIDINDALDECLRVSGQSTATLMGVRLGATLAAQVVSGRTDVDTLVLYAPVTDSDRLFDEWLQQQIEYDRSLGRSTGRKISDQVIGYPLTRALRDQLSGGFDFPGPDPALRRVLLLVDDVEEQGAKALSGIMAEAGARIDLLPTGVAGAWRCELSEPIVPVKLLRRIMNWITDES